MKHPIRQTSEPCLECQSYYRRGDHCNKCKKHAPVQETETEKKYTRAGRECVGR